MNNKLKILVSYHKKAVLLKNDILVPIQLGRAINNQISKDGALSKNEIDYLNQNMIGDDTGDNISILNRYLCENTASYWAWKNYDKLDNPDYIGFMHYRRNLILEPKIIEHSLNKQSACYHYMQASDLYKDKIYCNTDEFIKNITDYDIFTPNIAQIKETVFEHFKNFSKLCNLDYKIFEKVIDKIRKDFPEYNKSIDYFLNSKQHYWYNCFIMKKELFFEYAQFLFSVLLETHKEINYTVLGTNEKRILGFISERLTGLFIVHKTIFDNKKNKNIPLVFFEFTDSRKMNFIKRVSFNFKRSVIYKICRKFYHLIKK